ncbi:MAG: hypothetical protein FWD64_02415 [Acidobacteriaceae bacterium]|nr:hypothetical protein [Acidobacteriaceae bacterium]
MMRSQALAARSPANTSARGFHRNDSAISPRQRARKARVQPVVGAGSPVTALNMLGGRRP